MDDPTAQEVPASLPPQVLAALKWLATALGVTGLLLVLGFISEFAYQDRLGYHIGTEEVTEYSSEAGRFLLTLLIASTTWTAQHPWIALATLGVGVAAGFGWSRLHGGGRRHALGLAVLALLLAAVLIVFDLPTVGLQNALIAPVTEPRAAYKHGPIGALTRQAWETEVCSRIQGSLVTAFQNLGGSCRETQDFYEQRRQDRFALNALLTLGLSILAAIAVLESPSFRFHYALSGVVFLLSLLDLLLLPYMYAKSARPTPADGVKVQWVGAEAKDPAVPALSDTEFFLLFKTKDEVALLARQSEGEGEGEGEESQEDDAARVGTIWVVPRSQVRLLQIVDQEDVLKYVIGEKLRGVAAGTAPGGSLAPH